MRQLFSRRLQAGIAISTIVLTLSQASPPVQAHQTRSQLTLDPTTVNEEDVLEAIGAVLYEGATGGLYGVAFGALGNPGIIVGGLVGFGVGMIVGGVDYFLGDPVETTGLKLNGRLPRSAFD
jgi:hypothetical protein